MKLIAFAATLCAFSAIASNEHTDHTPKLSKLGEGKVTEYVGRNIHHHVRVGDLKSQVALFEETLPPKSLGAPPHRHENEDEIFIVLKGKVHFLNIDQEITADAGTIASLPRGYMHGFWNPYDEPVHLLVIVAPGHFDMFFEAVEAAIKKAPNATPEQIGEIIGQEAIKMNVHVDMSMLPDSGRQLLAPPKE